MLTCRDRHCGLLECLVSPNSRPVVNAPNEPSRAIAHDPEVYADPFSFKPERWLDPNGSANQNPKNYLVFGSGPHKCIGLEYAMMNIALVLADAVTLMDWEHVKTEKSDKNIEVLTAWRTITSNPQFKVRRVLCLPMLASGLFGSEADMGLLGRRTWTSTSSAPSSRTRRAATGRRSCSSPRA